MFKDWQVALTDLLFGELQDMQLERLLVEGLKCQVKELGLFCMQCEFWSSE